MLPETHPLIEAVTAPLAHNAEHRIATHSLLEETFDAGHPDIDEALTRLENAPLRKFPKLRKVLPWLVAAIALGAAIMSYLPEIRFITTISQFSLFEPWEKPALPKGLSQQERTLLGEPKLTELEQKHRLHLSDLENPAYYAEYAQAWVSEHEGLPSDYLETVARIDPDNAFFLFYAASVIGRESIEKQRTTSAKSPRRIVDGVRLPNYSQESQFTIKDQVSYENALALLEEAAKLSKFKTYTNQIIADRMRVLPIRTMTEFTSALIFVYGSPSYHLELMKGTELLSARAEELSKSGKKDDFIKLVNQSNALIFGLAHNPDVIFVNELIYRVIALNAATNFHAAAERLDLTELTERYRKQRDEIREEVDKRSIRGAKAEDVSNPLSSYSGFYHSSIPVIASHVNSPPPISARELQPMRLAEHEVVGGAGVLAVALLILPAAILVFLFRFMAPKSIRLASKRMTSLLHASDWWWVIGLGIALPVVIFLIISRWSPLSGRDWGITYIQFIFPGVHLVALLLSLLIVPAYVVRSRLVKRLAPFCLPDRFGHFPLLVIAGLVVWALAAQPIIQHFGVSQKMLYVLAVPPALCMCFLFANALRVIFEKSSTRFAQVATALVVLPAYPIAIVALCLLLPIYKAGEKHWLSKETLLLIDPDAPDLGAYEFRVAAQKRKEVNAIMGIE